MFPYFCYSNATLMILSLNLKPRNKRSTLLALILVSTLIGSVASFLALLLKNSTEFFEEILLLKATKFNAYYFLFPIVGLTIISVLRTSMFKNKENKGIKEVLESTQTASKNLPLYKIPSHFINGFLTVIFGGSTGIEVATVVASATIGSQLQQKSAFFRKYKIELICSGIAAGVTVLFCSPMAGILFSTEVISRKVNKVLLLTNGIAVAVASMILYLVKEPPMFAIEIKGWHWYAIPYFIILGILAGINSVFLTKNVLFFKALFLTMEKKHTKILLAALILGSAFFLFPNLYGDGYHGIKEVITNPKDNFTVAFFIAILGVLLLKPIVTAVTLGAGGDGGVFAPSLVIGAFLGFFVATFLNTVFDAKVIPINFIIIGMAALLSASIHAPFTALFLVCSLINDYSLFFPLVLVCLISKYTAKQIYPDTVYSYTLKLDK